MSDYSRYSTCASLAYLGKQSQKQGLWEEIGKRVQIGQKQVRYRPVEKLEEAWITILAGGEGVSEVNTRLRSEPGVLKAFGLAGCAEQSTISRTLSACTEANVEQMRAAVQRLYRQHSQGYRHDYQNGYQLLDVDMTGLLAGRQGEGVTKGYFAEAKNRRGRQVGRVLATHYNEVVIDRLYNGKKQLETCLQELVEAAEGTLELDEERRTRTILRADGGGGRDEDINWALARGYRILIKVKNWQRTHKLVKSVATWYPDPRHPTRELGWVDPPFAYRCPTRQVAMRETHADGRIYQSVIVLNLADAYFFAPHPPSVDPQAILSAILQAYDLRSGGIETSNRNSKSGLGLNHRNKQRFAAQEMLVLLAQLAYNFLSWIHLRLALALPRFQSFGWLRMIRDLFHIPGMISYSLHNEAMAIRLSRDHPLAKPFCLAVAALPPIDDLSLCLRKI